jgi:Flp pilus assembly protein TadD
MLLQTGRLSDAETVLRQSLRIGLDTQYTSEAHNLLGTSIAQQGRIDDALTAFEAAVRIDPTNRNARQNAAIARQALANRIAPETPRR